MSSRLKQAIALEYGLRNTPVVTAKGTGGLAEKILAEAERSGVHVAQDPELAALLGQLNTDEAIPTELYTSVAVILCWVYWLKGMRPGDEKHTHPREAERDSG